VTVRRAAAWVLAGLAASVLAWAAGAGPAAAEVDRAAGTGPVAWGDSCLVPGATAQYTVYGRDWTAAQTVDVTLRDAAGAVIAAVAADPVAQTDRGGVFQITFEITAPGDPATGLTLNASQPASDTTSSPQAIALRPSCAPTLSARPLTTCTQPGQPVPIEITGGGWPARTGPLKHYIDLFGPSERIDRTDRPHNTYVFTIGVSAPAGGVVVITAEGPNQKVFLYATTSVAMPASCVVPTTAPPPTVTTVPGVVTTATTLPVATTFPITVPNPVVGAASLVVTPKLGRTGETARVQGTGFPPNAPVILRWQPGLGQWAVTARADGSFDTRVLVLPKDPVGRRVLQAVSSATAAPAPYLVIPASEQPSGFDSSVFLRG
jgi:hypothetical protein